MNNKVPVRAVIEVDLAGALAGARNEDEPVSVAEEILNRAAALYLAESLGNRRGELAVNLRDQIVKTVEEHVAEHVQVMVRDAVAASLQRTDEWGQAKGQPVSMADYVRSQVDAALKVRVDASGRSVGAYDRQGSLPLVDFIVRKMAAEQVEALVKAQTAEVAKTTRDVIAGLVAAKFAPKV